MSCPFVGGRWKGVFFFNFPDERHVCVNPGLEPGAGAGGQKRGKRTKQDIEENRGGAPGWDLNSAAIRAIRVAPDRKCSRISSATK